MSATATVSRQQQRTENTRNTILDAAVRLYQEQGMESTSISEIIAASGLGRTTFYRYFKDQDEVLNQAVIRDFEQLMSDYEGQGFAYDDPKVQIVETTLWFNRQRAIIESGDFFKLAASKLAPSGFSVYGSHLQKEIEAVADLRTGCRAPGGTWPPYGA